MKIPLFQIDAFTDKIFGGNPAAVCPLDYWLDDTLLQNIASENNLAETVFFVHLSENRYHIRWFTPEIEMDLCGHATLASAHVLFNEINIQGSEIEFESRSGKLIVRKLNEYLEMDFPSRPAVRSTLPLVIAEGMGAKPLEVWKARDYVLLYESEETVARLQPNVSIINQINIDPGGIITTAASRDPDIDFVSRFFTPQASIFEDPVTGSAHCTLIPFWAQRLQKNRLTALQISQRQGKLYGTLLGDRVKIKGKTLKYLEGYITLPN